MYHKVDRCFIYTTACYCLLQHTHYVFHHCWASSKACCRLKCFPNSQVPLGFISVNNKLGFVMQHNLDTVSFCLKLLKITLVTHINLIDIYPCYDQKPRNSLSTIMSINKCKIVRIRMILNSKDQHVSRFKLDFNTNEKFENPSVVKEVQCAFEIAVVNTTSIFIN